jgi:hypothetical protein
VTRSAVATFVIVADFNTTYAQWREGERRLRDAPVSEQGVLERVVTRIAAELRRRLGGPYTSEEVADLYERGTDWATDIAAQVAPNQPWAWDPRVVVDAAFGRYVRGARDFAGGRRLET